jgi:malate dehydrogenase (oxaloacetate-decarboxylating)
MKLAASHAIAESLDEEHLNPDYIIPTVFDKSVTPKIAEAIAECHAKNH